MFVVNEHVETLRRRGSSRGLSYRQGGRNVGFVRIIRTKVQKQASNLFIYPLPARPFCWSIRPSIHPSAALHPHLSARHATFLTLEDKTAVTYRTAPLLRPRVVWRRALSAVRDDSWADKRQLKRCVGRSPASLGPSNVSVVGSCSCLAENPLGAKHTSPNPPLPLC